MVTRSEEDRERLAVSLLAWVGASGSNRNTRSALAGVRGTEGERNYFTDLAKAVPSDALILTAGCAKFRFNRLLEGQSVGPFPKVLDVGQCNDISGAIAIAVALADKLKIGVNELPLEFGVSWLEQKAVAQLLTCLHLGLTGIKLGPNLPAFVTPAVLGASATVSPGDTFTVAGLGLSIRGDGKSGGTSRAATLTATGQPGTLQIVDFRQPGPPPQSELRADTELWRHFIQHSAVTR